ncbi:hypothetical protein, partial [Lactobacillus mulieris]|uniref:hypothetical protein n=1 Tax=Lactobacillus mulieris TaxID=2508708 RepID=UPI002550D192
SKVSIYTVRPQIIALKLANLVPQLGLALLSPKTSTVASILYLANKSKIFWQFYFLAIST